MDNVYWHQGMLLQPQHFQLAELQQQFRAKPWLASGPPHFWGVGALSLAETAIDNRVVEIRSAHLLFSDRSYVEYPGNAVIAARAFDPAWLDDGRALVAHVALKRLARDANNVTVAAAADALPSVATRYVTLPSADDVSDLHSDHPPAPVRTLKHVLKIVFEHELDTFSGHETVPFARIVRDGERLRLDNEFVPPCYALSGSRGLLDRIRCIRDELAGRARQLQQYKSPREMQRDEFDASYTAFLLALRSLNRFGPLLFHLTECDQLHPWEIYGALRQLVGELSVFSERFNMLGEALDARGLDARGGLPPYDHRDLGGCFSHAHALIGHLLDEIAVGPDCAATFEPDGPQQPAQWSAQLPPDVFGDRHLFYLVIRSEHDPDTVAQRFLHGSRIAATDEMPQLTALALPGVELTRLPGAPQRLPRRSGTQYFRIEQTGRQWDAIRRDGHVSLRWHDAPDDLQVELVAVRHKS
ncbi:MULTISPECIES: type VI secretion system baseplate subunit TssK [Burkholderia]|uniref:type VI secretion system baseplate subunit TssK n=1 Tax=Burkholderia TaxID=32008 RepID=UPI00075650DD|nr:MULTISPECIES: type VI secretion system baseplate subunit TssK [Burkholderia]AOJ73612.1 type VI secretion protein [Burkholderia savannae]KVG41401.1 type VI secretion protein [Burkholderia sp. MSMB0265]KVG87920.1 type VI secretion protein [Burkholderia sp. MSMB2040]KVG96491.1 type VI secretion protein [Burkholderia sp. MSMB2041]KVH01638.1 type VI secretion protein [Burkholderia sp. MSMB2042]